MISPFTFLPLQPAAELRNPSPDALEHSGTYWMPDQASTVAGGVDSMYYAILGLSIICFVAITVAVVYFVMKYRYRKGVHEKPLPSPTHNDSLEITWTIIPSIIVVIIFVLGWEGYINMATPPKQALEIKVTAQKWSWSFSHKAGVGENVSDQELHVPVNRPVRLVMTSQDVLHSFWVPAFRVKQDVVPARYTYLWFTATRPGEYRLYCTEYCGKDHSQMKTKVVVHPAGGYETYLEMKVEEDNNMPPAELGKKKYPLCEACHSIDGSARTGPSFKGLFGREETLIDGSKVMVDENYLRESILDPTAKIVQGYQPVMPTFKGQLSDKQIDGLIEYIKSLK